MELSLASICEAVEGSFSMEPARPQEHAVGITWDSRTVQPGFAYLALPGERVDGARFAAAALEAGAVCAIVSHEPPQEAVDAARGAGKAIIAVPDAQQALTDLARAWRDGLACRVIGLTGSSGKTTTKNLVRDVLSASFAVTATAGNQNNELGVPNTLLSASAEDDAVVVEMGMRGAGQIAQLCSFVRPEWGLVTNVGTSHMELLGSRDAIACAKGELLEALPAGGWAFVNADDDYAAFLRSRARLDERGVRVALFDASDAAAQRAGLLMAGAPSDLVRPGDAFAWAEGARLDARGCATFSLHAFGFPGMQGVQAAECSLQLPGIHNVGNACSAAAVGFAMGMDAATIAAALGRSLPESGRAKMIETASGAIVVDDSYNANPDSMRASLRTFASLQAAGPKIAVLGDMGELGPFSEEGHRQVGAAAAQAGLDLLVCVGALARDIARAARDAGLPEQSVQCVDDAREALDFVAPKVGEGCAVLVKASHSVGLEHVVEGLVG